MLYLYEFRQFGFRYIIAINFFYYNMIHDVAKTIKFTYKFKEPTLGLFIKNKYKGSETSNNFVLEF